MPRPNETTHHQTLLLGSDSELRRRFMVLNEALQGNLRFGLLLEKLDKMAEETALKYVNCYHLDARVVTAAIDDIFVRHAADVNRDIAFHARINHVGRSSLVVGIRVEQPGEPVNHIASCHFTMVARQAVTIRPAVLSCRRLSTWTRTSRGVLPRHLQAGKSTSVSRH